MDANRIAVIGAGTMGSGIAQVFARSGIEVLLTDISDPAGHKDSKYRPCPLWREKVDAGQLDARPAAVSSFMNRMVSLRGTFMKQKSHPERLIKKERSSPDRPAVSASALRVRSPPAGKCHVERIRRCG
jgi:3-hydroxybutyryl-CoA dehydrogenase